MWMQDTLLGATALRPHALYPPACWHSGCWHAGYCGSWRGRWYSERAHAHGAALRALEQHDSGATLSDDDVVVLDLGAARREQNGRLVIDWERNLVGTKVGNNHDGLLVTLT